MRKHYSKPFKQVFSWLRLSTESYGKGGTIKYGTYIGLSGVVQITVTNWGLNDVTGCNPVDRTDFETVHKGYHHSMYVETSQLSERQIRIYAARFLRSITEPKLKKLP